MFGYIPVLLWKPVIEPDFGQERFLAQDPTLSFQSGRFQRVPVLGGITKDEFVNPAIGKFCLFIYEIKVIDQYH